MTPKEYYEKHCSSVIEKDDFIQECYLAMLENPKEEPAKLFKEVEKRLKKQANNDFYNTAPHLYNDDGECIDDEIYFVDKSTEEQYGSGRRIDITEDTEKHAKQLCDTVDLIYKLFKSYDDWSVRTTSQFLCMKNKLYFVENKRNKLTFERIDYFNRTFFRTNIINNLKSFKLKTKGVKI